MPSQSYTELTKEIGELKDTVLQFVAVQKQYNDLACKHEADLRGNGKDGIFTVLAKIDGRLAHVEDADKRRKGITDSLTIAVALTVILEIIRLVM
jgi:hypothetical protein